MMSDFNPFSLQYRARRRGAIIQEIGIESTAVIATTCRDCPRRPRCTDADYRAVSRLEHENALAHGGPPEEASEQDLSGRNLFRLRGRHSRH